MQEKRGRVFPSRGNSATICNSNTYLAPMSFVPKVSSDSMSSTLYTSYSVGLPILGAYEFKEMDSTNGLYDFIILNNKTLTNNLDALYFINLISDAMMRTLYNKPLVLSGIRMFPHLASTTSFDLIRYSLFLFILVEMFSYFLFIV